jgi:Tfp pilus assembly protein PilF
MQHRARSLFLALAIGTSTVCFAQVTEFNSTLPQSVQGGTTPSISGTIYGMDGVPLHDIRIEVRSLASGNLLETCYSGANGSFTAYGLHPGTYEVIAVDGIDQTQQEVQVDGLPATVVVRMPNRKGSPVAPGKGTVSVAQLKVPEKARHLAEKAQSAVAKGKNDQAVKFLNDSLAIAPDFANALTLRATIELTTNQPQAALDDLDKAVKADSSYGPAYLILGAVYNQMGRYDEALRSLDRSSIYDPASWQCAFESSKSWMGKHDYQRALQQLNRAQGLGGERIATQIHLLRGYALMGAKEFQQAGVELEAYLSADPNSQLSGTVRAALARMKTLMAQRQDSVPLPAMTGFFATAH